MIKQRSFQNYLFFLITVYLFGCSNKKKIDVSNIDLSIKIERFDREMDKLNPANLSSTVPELARQYGFFYKDYMEGMLSVGDTRDTGYFRNLRSVLSNRDYLELKKAVESKFPTLERQETELTDAFKHIRYYYPNQKLPRIISFFSGFTVQTPIGNDYVGIGLDMFLGADATFYPALRQSIPLYISRRFTPENITPRVMEAFIREEMFPEKDDDKTLLSKMIYNGKISYLMDAVLPETPDTLKTGYTKQQTEWCKTYEPDIWGYFLENNLLYETDYMKYQKYLTEAPFTPGIGERNESAPKLGIFIGRQIVRNYMEKNPEITLQQLMNETDAQKILNESKYKPK